MQSRQGDYQLHVLIIHRPNATEGYAAYLTSEGFRVSEASDGDDGVAKALELRPNLLCWTSISMAKRQGA